MPLPPRWEQYQPGEYPAAEPRPRPEHDRRPLVLPEDPRRRRTRRADRRTDGRPD